MSCGGDHLGFRFGIKNPNFTATAGHRLTLDPMGKFSNAFFSETTNMIKAKLYMNVHWMVLYNLKVFCCDMKNLVKDIPMIIPLQFGFSQFISFREEDL
jgi:hypothetical protein